MAKQDNKSFFSDWLEKLQQESWQLELLISGLALFGIYESQDLLNELKMYVQNNSEGNIRAVQYIFIGTLGVGWSIFFINLLIHVILRGLWIGAIGLRYVSNDIDYETLNYSEYFTQMLKNRVGRFDDFIERLEKICSVLFAYTFLLFLLFFSLAFFFLQLIIIGDLISDLGGVIQIIAVIMMLLYIFIGFVVFIDFITLGIFKKIEDRRVNKVYGYIFTFYGWTTLTFLYRPLLYNFLDNRYTKKLFYFSVPYILVILLAGNMFSNNNFSYFPPDDYADQFGHTVDRFYYEDLRQEYLSENEPYATKRRQNIPNVVLNKYMNNEAYLRIFLKMKPLDYKLVQDSTDIEPYSKSGLNFSLFNSLKNEDSFYTSGKEKIEVEIDSIKSIRKKLIKEKKKLTDSIQINAITEQVEDLNDQVSKIRKEFRAQGIVFEKEKQKKILDAFLSFIDLKTDEIDMKKDLDCYFFRHSNNNEKGIMCLYPMDSLSFGKHQLHFHKLFRSSNEKNYDVDIKIPFYKVRNYN